MKKSGCVYLVGASCGNADLITVRGRALLRSCDAVVYDDLIAPELLGEVPSHAERFYMGKRGGRPSAAQAEICAMLISLARDGRTVVRLKGGDPFVFGRGGEELLALRKAGIPCEAVPGVSSAIAIPALAGIPVTHRGVSQSVHIITGHTADTPDGLPVYLDTLARLPGTLVFLMGLAQLRRIAERLMNAGMAAETPAAVISGGNAPCPVTVRGTLRDIAPRAERSRVQPPAVIVVGKAASINLSAAAPLSLSGVRVGLTGTAMIHKKLCSALQTRGAETFCVERSAVEALPFSFELRSLCGLRCWLVFTSGNGVRLFFQHLARQKMDLRQLRSCKFAVIGSATAAALERFGIQADLCPETYTSQALGEKLLQTVRPNEPVFLFRSNRGSPELYRTLAAKFSVRDIPIYGLHAKTAPIPRESLGSMDYLTFSSASGVELFYSLYEKIPERATCVCIGGITADALRRRYGKPFLTAARISAEGIVETIERHRKLLFQERCPKSV